MTGLALPGDLAWGAGGRLYTTDHLAAAVSLVTVGTAAARGARCCASTGTGATGAGGSSARGLYRFTVTADARGYHRTARGTVRVVRRS